MEYAQVTHRRCLDRSQVLLFGGKGRGVATGAHRVDPGTEIGPGGRHRYAGPGRGGARVARWG